MNEQLFIKLFIIVAHACLNEQLFVTTCKAKRKHASSILCYLLWHAGCDSLMAGAVLSLLCQLYFAQFAQFYFASGKSE